MKAPAIFLAFLLPATAVSAASLDFTTVTPVNLRGGIGSTTLDLPEATVSTSDGEELGVGLLLGGTSANAFCALAALDMGEGGCNADAEILFKQPVTNLTFGIVGGAAGDEIAITFYDMMDVQLGSTLTFLGGVTASQLVDVSVLAPIKRLVIDDSSAAASGGYSYQDFTFEQAAVPLPAGLVLLLSGLGVLGLVRARKPHAA